MSVTYNPSMTRESAATGQERRMPDYEIIDCTELAKRLTVPTSWVRDQVRTRAIDPIPCLRLGRYCRFQWGHPALAEWLGRRQSHYRKNVR